MKTRHSDPRFTGAGLVYGLFALCCLVVGCVGGALLIQVLS